MDESRFNLDIRDYQSHQFGHRNEQSVAQGIILSLTAVAVVMGQLKWYILQCSLKPPHFIAVILLVSN